MANLDIEVPTLTGHHQAESAAARGTRALLRNVALALLAGEAHQASASASAKVASPPGDERLLTFKLRASVPLGGFQRTDVSRLVLTFGRIEDVAPVRLAVFLQPVSAPEPDNDQARDPTTSDAQASN